MATGILPWLTPLAAMGLAINVLMATGFHVREDERLKAMATTLWAAIAGIIAIGRWNLVEQAALAVLLPAVIIIVTIIYRHPPPRPSVCSGSPAQIAREAGSSARR